MWEYNYTDELYHYGVKGMRWGHRKALKYQNKAKRARDSADEWDEMAGYAESRGKTKRAAKYRKYAEKDRADATYYDKQQNAPGETKKKALLIGAAVAATALAAYGAYKIHSIKQQNVAIGRSKAQAALDMYKMIGQDEKGHRAYADQMFKVSGQNLKTAYKNVKEARGNLKYNPGYYGDNVALKRNIIRYIGK